MTYKSYKLNGEAVRFLVISLILLHCATSINGRSVCSSNNNTKAVSTETHEETNRSTIEDSSSSTQYASCDEVEESSSAASSSSATSTAEGTTTRMKQNSASSTQENSNEVEKSSSAASSSATSTADETTTGMKQNSASSTQENRIASDVTITSTEEDWTNRTQKEDSVEVEESSSASSSSSSDETIDEDSSSSTQETNIVTEVTITSREENWTNRIQKEDFVEVEESSSASSSSSAETIEENSSSSTQETNIEVEESPSSSSSPSSSAETIKEDTSSTTQETNIVTEVTITSTEEDWTNRTQKEDSVEVEVSSSASSSPSPSAETIEEDSSSSTQASNIKVEIATSIEKKTSEETSIAIDEYSSSSTREESCETVSIKNMTFTIDVCYEEEKKSYYMKKAQFDLETWFTAILGRTIFYSVEVTHVSESTDRSAIVISFTLQLLQLDITVDGLYGDKEFIKVYKKLTTAITSDDDIMILNKKVISIDLTRLKAFAYPTCADKVCPAGEVCFVNYEGFTDCIKDPCLTKKCTENGRCFFNSTTRVAKCLCRNTDEFIYSGEYCEILTSKLALSRTNIIIICVVVGLVLLILLGLAIGFCCFYSKRRRRINLQVKQEQRYNAVVQQTALPMTRSSTHLVQTCGSSKKRGYDIGQYDNRVSSVFEVAYNYTAVV